MFNECLEIRWKLLIFASLIFPSKSFRLRSNVKHSTQCFITRWNTSTLVKNTPLRVLFSTLFLVFHLVMNHCVSVSLNSQWEVTNAGMPKGTELQRPNNRSETASDATNMFGIVLIRWFNNITRSVREFPTNKSNRISTNPPNNRIALALLLDWNSLNISASWFSVEFGIFCCDKRFLVDRKVHAKG